MDLTLGLGESTGSPVCMEPKLDLERRIKVVEENRGREPVQLNLLPLAPVLQWSAENRNLKSLSVEEAEEGRMVSTSKRGFSRGGEEEENERGRKKLRLSKEQSAFLEESFKKQNTLNPKLKFYLAKQLNLRPRQIEVWFQNRRARTKLKLMEMDCEFLKRRCEMLREENRRLHREVAELRGVKTFSFQMPPTTLSICPSCEHISPPTSPPRPPPTPR